METTLRSPPCPHRQREPRQPQMWNDERQRQISVHRSLLDEARLTDPFSGLTDLAMVIDRAYRSVRAAQTCFSQVSPTAATSELSAQTLLRPFLSTVRPRPAATANR